MARAAFHPTRSRAARQPLVAVPGRSFRHVDRTFFVGRDTDGHLWVSLPVAGAIIAGVPLAGAAVLEGVVLPLIRSFC